MSTVTPNLGLFKYDTTNVTDLASAFNINTALNNNWDKIDEAISNSGVARNIGEIVTSTVPLTNAGLHLLDGALIQGSGSYSAFVTYIAGLVSTYPSVFTTESAWQSSVSTYGVCGKFVYDSVNNTVRLPKVTGIIEGTTDVNALGDLVQAGLPNITGNFYLNGTEYQGSQNGAFYFGGNIDTNANTGHTDNGWSPQVNIDASRSSSVYGNSSTVQPQTIRVLYYIVIATSTKTDVQVDIDDIATDLNGKMDTDLSNMSASQSAKDTVMNWGMPDYSNNISISSGFVAPSKGWISINCFTQTANTDTYVYINGITITGLPSGGGMVSNATQIPVDKNDTITYHNAFSALFFPMKGVN